MGFYQWLDKQDKGIKILLLIPFWGWIFSFLYRLDKFIENKDIASLLGFILAIIPATDFFVALVDLVTVIAENRIMFLVSGGENFGINGKVDTEQPEDKKEDNTVDADFTEVKDEK